MAKFYGKIGYGQTVNRGNGIHEEVVVDRFAMGDILRNTRRLVDGEKINDDLSVGNSVSIVADAYSSANFFAIRYVEWMGALWKVTEVEVQSPRLLLRLGGVYNGPKGTPADNP